jgi:hypothetical protein
MTTSPAKAKRRALKTKETYVKPTVRDEREFQRYIRKLRRDRRKAEIEEFRVRLREALGLAA